MQAAPLWLYVVAALAPWIPILVLELIWTYRHYRWLAVFCLLLVTQSTYLLEQVAPVVQVHVLGRDVLDVPGIFGALDVERVHLVWTSWAVLGVLLLASRFPRNPWLGVTLVLVGWDAVSRRVMPMQVDLQFAYSVLEIAALNLAFALQLGRTYDAQHRSRPTGGPLFRRGKAAKSVEKQRPPPCSTGAMHVDRAWA